MHNSERLRKRCHVIVKFGVFFTLESGEVHSGITTALSTQIKDIIAILNLEIIKVSFKWHFCQRLYLV